MRYSKWSPFDISSGHFYEWQVLKSYTKRYWSTVATKMNRIIQK
jgi:hypothetical protein